MVQLAGRPTNALLPSGPLAERNQENRQPALRAGRQIRGVQDCLLVYEVSRRIRGLVKRQNHQESNGTACRVHPAYVAGEQIAGTRYRVLGLLGRGGMGAVYEVEHIELGKRFVLKILHHRLGTREDLVARMNNEWCALGRLSHPNIVQVTDAGRTASHLPYYVMERLSGQTLAALVRGKGRLSVREASGIVIDVLAGLSAAHAKGIVHRDIKPQNIFVTQSSGTKLLDFGIAKLRDQATKVVTANGIAIGTPRFMAPEQAEGTRVDARADIYAAGLCLYEALVGRDPFAHIRDPNELVLAHMGQEPERADWVRADVGEAIGDLLARWLAKSPDARPRTAALAQKELQSVASSITTGEDPDSLADVTAAGTYDATTCGASDAMEDDSQSLTSDFTPAGTEEEESDRGPTSGPSNPHPDPLAATRSDRATWETATVPGFDAISPLPRNSTTPPPVGFRPHLAVRVRRNLIPTVVVGAAVASFGLAMAVMSVTSLLSRDGGAAGKTENDVARAPVSDELQRSAATHQVARTPARKAPIAISSVSSHDDGSVQEGPAALKSTRNSSPEAPGTVARSSEPVIVESGPEVASGVVAEEEVQSTSPVSREDPNEPERPSVAPRPAAPSKRPVPSAKVADQAVPERGTVEPASSEVGSTEMPTSGLW